MAKPPRRANYRHKLTRPLTLQDGRKLATLRDGANVLLDVLVRSMHGPAYLTSASADCSRRRTAAATPDIQAATDALGARRMLADQ